MSQIRQMSFEDLLSGFRQNPVELMDDALKNNFTLTRYLDVICPPDKNEAATLNRILREEKMAYISSPARGHYASRTADFMKEPHHRMLLAELCYNRARHVWYGGDSRAITLSDDATAGSMLRPFVDRVEALLDTQISPAIPLSEIVAFTNFISSRDYRALYFNVDEDEVRSYRIPEATDIPAGILQHTQNTINLQKTGQGIFITDEVLRDANVRIDRILVQVELIALQAEADRVEDAVAVLEKGDGNPNSVAQVYPLTEVIPDESTTTLERGWTSFEMKFKAPFELTRALAREKEVIDLKYLTTGNNNIVQLTLPEGTQGNPFFPMLQPINPITPVTRVGIVETVTDGRIIGFDHRLALERVVETGSEIQEMTRFARNQTNFLGITENSAFAIYQPNAIKVLNTAA